MNTSSIPELLGTLSHDIILVCNDQGVVQEANQLARQLLGEAIVGRLLLDLMTAMSYHKGEAFLNYLYTLPPNTTGDAWELLFHVPRSIPLRVSARGGALAGGGWLIVGGCEPPQLVALYHEVLAINSELTNLIRQLCKEQATLTSQVTHLLHLQEHLHAN